MSEPGIVQGLPANISIPPAKHVGEEHSSDSLAPPRVFAGASIYQVAFSFATMLGTCLVARVFYSLRAFKVDPDLWWHIKVGQDILATHRWPIADPYSFSAAGHHWLAYEWLGDVFLALVWHIGGVRGLGAILIFLGGLIAIAFYAYTSMRCGNPKAGFLATAVLLNLVNSLTLRPHMLGYFFLILTLIILERFRQGRRGTIWLMPPLMLIWVNVHGSWIIGLATVCVYLVGGLAPLRLGNLETSRWSFADRRRLIWVLVLGAAATMITPYGAGLARYPFQVASSLPVNVANIQEWQPMKFSLPGDKLFLGLVLGFLLVQLIWRRKWRLEEVGLFLFATLMACLHIRFLSLFALFFAPLLVEILARWLPRYERAKEIYVLNAVIIFGITAGILWYFPSTAEYNRIVRENFPVEAVEYLNTHRVPEPMYNTYAFGGYLIFTRAPEHKVFIDGRGDFYEDAGVFSDDAKLMDLKPGSLSVLDKYGIQSCLLVPDEPLATILAALPEWQQVYGDGTSAIFIRR
jgi:hypothetical protein